MSVARPVAAGSVPAQPSVPPERFRSAFRAHPAGVAVITVPGSPRPAGFTATSLVSLSLTPPLVCFSIAATASSWAAVRDATTAVAHLLAADQEDIARRFATSGIDRFAAPTRYRLLPGGTPLLDEVGTWLLLSLESLIPAGDHHLVTARVRHVTTTGDHRPLLYHDGTYRTLEGLPPNPR
ncbi:flavin reductase family protein [Streptomyces sp. NPDC006465]|uniref:flavin reductase family protein n=1 Tax=Streptomyces sp. NPDC006465 TaxID=3157174 RepID=UPI0033A8695A